jgi:hypothetical protein
MSDDEQMPENKVFELIARIGLFSYAVVHLIVAWLAVQVGLGDHAKVDKKGALQLVADGAGVWLIWLAVVGLGVLMLWQLWEVFAGHKHVKPQRKALRRAVSALEVVLYGILTYSAAKIAIGSKEATQSSVVAKILAQPWGEALITVAGVGVLGVSAFLVYRGISKGFERQLDFGKAHGKIRKSTIRLGQIGWPALGAAYGCIGVMLIVSAANYDPAKASGMDIALKNLAVQPYGQPLLLVLAVGIAAFGVFALLDARFRKL